jgi:hypothetical protein
LNSNDGLLIAIKSDLKTIDEVVDDDDDDELKTFYCSLMLNGTILLCTSSTRTHLVVYTSSKNFLVADAWLSASMVARRAGLFAINRHNA